MSPRKAVIEHIDEVLPADYESSILKVRRNLESILGPHGYAVLRVSTNAQDEQSQRRDLLRSVCKDVVFDPVLHRVNLTLDYGDFCTHCLVAPTGFVLMGAPSRPVSIGKIDTEYMEVAA